jgi:hypothetical protein
VMVKDETRRPLWDSEANKHAALPPVGVLTSLFTSRERAPGADVLVKRIARVAPLSTVAVSVGSCP